MEKERKLERSLSWYKRLSKHPFLSEKWQNDLAVLVAQFEKGVLRNHTRFSRYKSIKAIFAGSVLKTIVRNPIQIPENTIFFWPFQFLHCDFMVPVISALREQQHESITLVFRENLVPYCAKKEEIAYRLHFKRSLQPLHYLIKNLWSDLIFILVLSFSPVPRSWKGYVLRALLFTGLIREVEAACTCYLKKGAEQFHMIGYDLSVLGKIITREANKFGIPSGRIQNGAANYHLAGLSEVRYLFLWDQVSAKAYRRAGYKGHAMVLGNLLLAEKLKEKSSKKWLEALTNQPSEEIIQRPICFIALSGPGHNTSEEGHIEAIRLIDEITQQWPEILFIIKLHPKDKAHYYKRLDENANVFATFSLVENLKPDALDILLISDFLLTGASSVALDAFSLNIGVISIDPFKELQHFSFIHESETVQQVFSEEDISKLSATFDRPIIDKADQVEDVVQSIVDVILQEKRHEV